MTEDRISHLIEEYEQRRRATINLVASENIMSMAAKRALVSDFAHRYLLPPADELPEQIWEYPNQTIGRRIEKIAKATAMSMFGGQYVDIRPLSGNNVAAIVLAALTQRDNRVVTVPSLAGGHFATPALCQWLGLQRHDLCYDIHRGRVDIDASACVLRDVRPKLIYLDASMILFPYPLSELRSLVGSDCVIAYDASHCFGLIAGGAFQAPLYEGADLLVGSTHKSMFGPQKGIIVAKDDGIVAAAIHDIITPLFVSNVHAHHVAALAVTLEELATFGADYANRVIDNARELAGCLYEAGIEVLYAEQNFTECHQILCRLPDTLAKAALERLQRCGIHVNSITVPFVGGAGLRLGTAEITRRGFGGASIVEIAGCIVDAIHERRPAAEIAEQIRSISLAHPDILFGFDATRLDVITGDAR